MAFTFTTDGHATEGKKKYYWGTFSNDSGSTGGNVDTGLAVCEILKLTHTGSSVVDDKPSVNETLPVGGSAVTIVTTANASGCWRAEGY